MTGVVASREKQIEILVIAAYESHFELQRQSRVDLVLAIYKHTERAGKEGAQGDRRSFWTSVLSNAQSRGDPANEHPAMDIQDS